MAQKFSKSEQRKRKPSWSSAPGWANWLAMDIDGEWCWHEDEPHIDHWGVVWSSLTDGQQTHAATEIDPAVIRDWKNTKEGRPPA